MFRSSPARLKVRQSLGAGASSATLPAMAQSPDRPDTSAMADDVVKERVALLAPTVKGAGIRL